MVTAFRPYDSWRRQWIAQRFSIRIGSLLEGMDEEQKDERIAS